MKKMRKYFLSTAVMTLVQAPTIARSIVTAVLQFFPGQHLTPASAPATILVTLARMKWILVQVINYKWNLTIYVHNELSRLKQKLKFLIKIRIINECVNQKWMLITSVSLNICQGQCKKKATRHKQYQRVESFFTFMLKHNLQLNVSFEGDLLWSLWYVALLPEK